MADTSTLISAAQKAHPAFRFGIAVAGLGALVVVFVSFGLNLATIVFGTAIILGLMTFFVAFIRVSSLSRRALTVPALVILWTSIIVVLASITLLFTSAFFNVPIALRARLLSDATSNVPPVQPQPATPDRVRIALVAANWDYHDGPLRAPPNDMQLVSEALREVGFQVIELPNATRSEFLTTWNKVETVGNYGGISLLYYSGRGNRKNGEDFISTIVPRFSDSAENDDIRLAGVRRISEDEADAIPLDGPPEISVTSLLRRLRSFDSTLVGAKGHLALFSTAPGWAATDTGPDGQHSPFAVAFAASIRSNSGDLRAVFDEVARRTNEMTHGAQSPWMAGTFSGPFNFRDRSKDRDIGILRVAVLDICRGDKSPR